MRFEHRRPATNDLRNLKRETGVTVGEFRELTKVMRCAVRRSSRS